MDATPLRDQLKQDGAELGDVDGAEVALAFDDLEVEHRAVRTAAGVLDLHPLGVGRLTGEDRLTFLHDVMTNAVEDRIGQVVETAFMKAEGEIAGYFHLAMLDDASLLLVRGELDPLVDAMGMVLMISDVELEDAGLAGIAIQGPDAGDVLDAVDLPHPLEGRVETVDGTTVLGIDSTGSGGVWIVAPPDRAAAIRSEAIDAGAAPVGHRAREALRIEAGYPAWGAEVTGDDLPQECGIRHAVDFEKGCYPGQEAVAKLENLGRPRRHLEILVLEGPVPEPGAPVTADGALIGEVTSAAPSPTAGGVGALALLKRDEGQPGTEVTVGDTRGRVADGPIHRA